MRKVIEVNGKIYPVKIHLENRTDSTVSIRKNGVTIHLPDFLNREEIAREVFSMQQWAQKKLQENPERYTPRQQKIYKHGDILHIGDQQYILSISSKEKQSSSARIINNIIELVVATGLSEGQRIKHVSTLLSRSIARKRLPSLKQKIQELNTLHFQKPLKNVYFKYNKSNWGSCSRDGNINISTRLLFAPDAVLEYICIHELAHLTEQNHSENFWKLVEGAMPNYKEKEQWLKDNDDACWF